MKTREQITKKLSECEKMLQTIEAKQRKPLMPCERKQLNEHWNTMFHFIQGLKWVSDFYGETDQGFPLPEAVTQKIHRNNR